MHTEITDRLEYDADFGNDIFKACGINTATPETMGIPMSLGAWFNGTKFCRPFLYYFLYQSLMVGNIGPKTPGMGVVCTYRTRSKIFNETLAKAEAFIKATKYRGYLGIDCVLTGDGVYVKRWVVTPNPIVLMIHKDIPQTGPFEEFIRQLLLGKAENVPIDTSKWNVSICVYHALPLCIQNIYTASDVNLKVAEDRVYQLIREANIDENLIYRIDIGEDVRRDMDTLKSWDWIR